MLKEADVVVLVWISACISFEAPAFLGLQTMQWVLLPQQQRLFLLSYVAASSLYESLWRDPEEEEGRSEGASRYLRLDTRQSQGSV